MKRTFTLLISIMLIAFAFQALAQRNAVYPGADTLRVYKAPKAAVAPVIDGEVADAAWAAAPWKTAFAVTPLDPDWATGTPAGKEGAFAGADDASLKYKFVWDDKTYYMLLRYTDDEVIYTDIHDGYMKASSPSWAKVTFPAVGAGTGTPLNSWRIDQISTMFANYAEAFKTSYSRADKGLWYNFFPAQVNKTTHADSSVIWAPKHNNPTNNALPSSHKGKCVVACKYNATEKAYYIELKDTTWATLFASVKTKDATQKDFATTPVAIGDKFFFSGEFNDADGITNRRDYSIYIGHLRQGTPNVNNTMAEAVVIELVDKIVGVNTTSLNSEFIIYPNPNSTDILNLNRAADVEISNIAGQIVLKSLNSSKINISSLKQGVYIVKDNDGNIQKMIRN